MDFHLVFAEGVGPFTEKKLRHGILWDVAVELGGVPSLAAALRCEKATVYAWCNLRSWPAVDKWLPQKRAAFNRRLVKITGYTIEQVFPPQFRQYLDCCVTSHSVKSKPKGLFPPHLEDHRTSCPLDDEAKEWLEMAIKRLRYRDQQVLIHRFGLFGEQSHSLDELKAIFRVGRERIRQLEVRATNNLLEQLKQVSRTLFSEWEGSDVEFSQMRERIFVLHEMNRWAEQHKKQVTPS